MYEVQRAVARRLEREPADGPQGEPLVQYSLASISYHTVGGICFATPNPKYETRIGEVISRVNGAEQS